MVEAPFPQMIRTSSDVSLLESLLRGGAIIEAFSEDIEWIAAPVPPYEEGWAFLNNER